MFLKYILLFIRILYFKYILKKKLNLFLNLLYELINHYYKGLRQVFKKQLIKYYKKQHLLFLFM